MQSQDLNSVLNALYARLQNETLDFHERLKISEKLVETEPSVAAYLKYSSDLIEAKAFLKAETVLKKAVVRYPDDHKLRYRLAEIISLSHGEEVAIEHYIKTIEMFHFHKKSYAKIVTFYEKRERDLAIDYCRKGTELFPGDAWFDQKIESLTKTIE